MGVKSNEKRTLNRAKRRILVRYGLSAAERTAFTKNLSSTGMFLQTNQVFKPGSTIHVEMRFPKETFSLWARVVWAKVVPPQLAHVLECGMGLHFIEPPPEWNKFFQEWKKTAGVIDDR